VSLEVTNISAISAAPPGKKVAEKLLGTCLTESFMSLLIESFNDSLKLKKSPTSGRYSPWPILSAMKEGSGHDLPSR